MEGPDLARDTAGRSLPGDRPGAGATFARHHPMREHMRTKKSLQMTAAALLGLCSLAPGLARANFMPILVSVTPNGPNFDYLYQVDLTAGDRADTGSFLVLYDFNGLVGSPSFVNDGTAINGGRFSLTTQATG